VARYRDVRETGVMAGTATVRVGRALRTTRSVGAGAWAGARAVEVKERKVVVEETLHVNGEIFATGRVVAVRAPDALFAEAEARDNQ